MIALYDIQRWLLFFTLSILLFGLVMIFSTTSFEILDVDGKESGFVPVAKQALYLLLGTCLGWVVNKLGPDRFWRAVPLLFWVIVFLLAITLIPGIGREVNGSRRWLSILGFSFQPSEFAKLIVPLYFANSYFADDRQNVGFRDFLQLLGKALIPIFLIIVEPNNGTALVVLSTLFVVFFLLKVPFQFWGWPLVLLFSLGALFAWHHPYVQKRLYVFWHPEADLRGKGHQPYQAKIAIGSGGAFGNGLGQSMQKLHYLPEAQNDYIAAIVAEEMGFLGICLLLFLYLGLSFTGALIVLYQKNQAYMVMGAVIVFLLTFQPFLNLAVVSGLLPSTGLNLPLFSQGGTSLMANLAFIALLYAMAKERKGDE